MNDEIDEGEDDDDDDGRKKIHVALLLLAHPLLQLASVP